MDFPRLVYRSESEHVLVENGEQYNERIADGWYGSVPEALAPKPLWPVDTRSTLITQPVDDYVPPPSADDTATSFEQRTPTRDELETRARELGIKFDGRNSDVSLKRKIDEALNA